MTARGRPIPLGLPLAVWERDGLAAALGKAGLSTADVQSDNVLFWRYENDDVPVGFGGLEILGDQALLRAVVSLPPVRGRGIGSGILASLETEARARGCRVIWLVTDHAVDFFARRGYRKTERSAAPEPIQETGEFTRMADGAAMMKELE